ncbi:MAG: phosphatidylglycerophosphatase A [Alphaproteobacteria bacterium]|nr:MAG: phosphatidylglycerophosphatase A [Alphaproteobacteria bacterium]
MTPARLIATGFGLGLLPRAPGTWGALGALPAGWILHGLGGFPLLAGATVAAFLAGLWAVARETRPGGASDPPEFVIDEIAGQWVALWPLSGGLWWMGADPWLFPWPGWLGAFALFRLFDILKPPPVGWADRLGTPLGVMLDDLIAGIMAAGIVILGAAVAHGWLA